MPVDDLLEHARSGTDFYALLGEDIHAGSSDKDISRAYRRTALKHHPDKNKDDPNAVAKFHSLQVAYDVLSDPAARAAYDAACEARERKKAQAQRLDGQRRAFADELLRAEREGIKRKRDDEGGEEDALEREIKRLAEDGRRRRQERADQLKREADAAREKEIEIIDRGDQVRETTGGTSIPAIARTVKVQFHREDINVKLDETLLRKLFSVFGEVESVFMLKDKKQRLAAGQHKQVMGHAGIVFSSVTGAYSAVTQWRKEQSQEWELFNHIDWAEGKEPDYIQALNYDSRKSKPERTTNATEAIVPNLEESTFLRLKKAQQRKAERKRHEDILRQQEAEETIEANCGGTHGDEDS